jgi:hypothetical protein
MYLRYCSWSIFVSSRTYHSNVMDQTLCNMIPKAILQLSPAKSVHGFYDTVLSRIYTIIYYKYDYRIRK